MADTELGELYGTAARPRGIIQVWVGIAGALTSLALIAGIGVWGYQLMVRDVNGIPVIRALAGPMRIQPKDPGGEQMAFQGLAVNQVAAEGEAGQIAEELTLAPPEPVLLDHDLPKAELTAAPLHNLTGATDAAVADVLSASAEAESVGAALIVGTDTLAQPVSLAVETRDAPVDDAVVAIAASVPGVVRSPRPPARPQAMRLAAATRAASTPEPAVEIPADTLPSGARLVQLGAFETPDLARSAWGHTADQFADVMAGKQRVIQQATAGGQTFYRLRVAGFTDLADARRFCAALAADRSNPLCVPVAIR